MENNSYTNNEEQNSWICALCGTENDQSLYECDNCQTEKALTVPKTINDDSLKVTPQEWYQAILDENEGDIISWMVKGQVDADKKFNFNLNENNNEKINFKNLDCKQIGPVHLSIILDKPEILLLLLNGGSNANLNLKEMKIIFKNNGKEYYEDISPLHLSFLLNSWKCAQILFSREINFNSISGKINLSKENRNHFSNGIEMKNITPLHCLAISKNELKIKEFFSEQKFESNCFCLFNWLNEKNEKISFQEFCYRISIKNNFMEN